MENWGFVQPGTRKRSLVGLPGSLVWWSSAVSATATVDTPDGDTTHRVSISYGGLDHNEKHKSWIQASEGATCCFCCVVKQSARRFPLTKLVKLSGILGFIIFVMHWLNTWSMKYTSQGSAVVLSTLSGPFYLVLSNLFLKEPIACTNVIGLVMVLGGSVLIWYQDDGHDNDESNPTLGNTLAVLSAFAYASYGTLMKLLIKDDSKLSTFLYLGLVGLWNVACLWPLFFVLDYSGLEHIRRLDWNNIGLLTLLGATTVLGDYFIARSILLISPLVVTVGLSFDVPLSLVADYLFFDKPMPFLYILGAGFLLVGFLLVNLAQRKDKDLKTYLTEDLGEKQSLITRHTP